MSDQIPASVLARQIADALEDDEMAIEVVEGPHGVSDVFISRAGLDAIYNAIMSAMRNGGISA